MSEISLPALNFPDFRFRIEQRNDKWFIFDRIRRKMVSLTPEEWVRQHVISYLIDIKGFPGQLLGVEKKLTVNGLTKRFDIVAFGNSGIPLLLIECKAPHIVVSQKTFDQAARYNMTLNASFFLITNGLRHYCCRMDAQQGLYEFIEEIPEYAMMKAF